MDLMTILKVILAFMLTVFLFGQAGPDVRAAIPNWGPLLLWVCISLALIRSGRLGGHSGGGRRHSGGHGRRFQRAHTAPSASVISMGVHEAGHSEAAKKGGIKVGRLKVNDQGGYTEVHASKTQMGSREYLRALASGAEAQIQYLMKEYRISRGQAERHLNCSDDEAMLHAYGSKATAQAKRDAKDFVRSHYGQIKRTGEKLAKRGSL